MPVALALPSGMPSHGEAAFFCFAVYSLSVPTELQQVPTPRARPGQHVLTSEPSGVKPLTATAVQSPWWASNVCFAGSCFWGPKFESTAPYLSNDFVRN